MDNNNNNDIRPPDQAIRETLVYDNYYNYNCNYNSDYDYDYNEIDSCHDEYDLVFANLLEQSKVEYEKELLQIQQREKERESLIALCNSVKNKINRIKGYDNTNQDIYATILYIMDMFEMEEIINYSLKKETFDKTFCLLGTLRMTSEELDFLHKLIIVAV